MSSPIPDDWESACDPVQRRELTDAEKRGIALRYKDFEFKPTAGARKRGDA